MEHVNSPSLAQAHPLRKIKRGHIDAFQLHAATQAFFSPVHRECCLWPSIVNGWQNFIIFPLLSSPFLRPSKQIHISPKCVFIHLRDLFWMVCGNLGKLGMLRSQWYAKGSWLNEAGFWCIEVLSGLPTSLSLYVFWSLHLWPLHQSELGSLEF